jgi:hypothetical protein
VSPTGSAIAQATAGGGSVGQGGKGGGGAGVAAAAPAVCFGSFHGDQPRRVHGPSAGLSRAQAAAGAAPARMMESDLAISLLATTRCARAEPSRAIAPDLRVASLAGRKRRRRHRPRRPRRRVGTAIIASVLQYGAPRSDCARLHVATMLRRLLCVAISAASMLRRSSTHP